MLQRLGDAAVHTAADQQNPPRCWVLKQRVVNRLFGGVFVRRVGEDHAVVINAADIASSRIASFGACFNDLQVAVDRVTRRHQMESLPQARLCERVQ